MRCLGIPVTGAKISFYTLKYNMVSYKLFINLILITLMQIRFAAFFYFALLFTACQTSTKQSAQNTATEQAFQLTLDSVQLSNYFPDTLLNRFQGEIDDFVRQDSLQPTPKQTALFVGSSSIRMWDSLQADMEPVSVINRGFGGSTIPEVLFYFDELILAHQPKNIYLYAGENDLAMTDLNITPAQVLETFQLFVNTVRAKLPDTKNIYFISIKPSVARWDLWPTMQEANQLIKDYASKQKDVYYVDVAAKMLQDDGTVRKDIFIRDSLHMNRTGYALWTETIKPDLLEDFEK